MRWRIAGPVDASWTSEVDARIGNRDRRPQCDECESRSRTIRQCLSDGRDRSRSLATTGRLFSRAARAVRIVVARGRGAGGELRVRRVGTGEGRVESRRKEDGSCGEKCSARDRSHDATVGPARKRVNSKAARLPRPIAPPRRPVLVVVLALERTVSVLVLELETAMVRTVLATEIAVQAPMLLASHRLLVCLAMLLAQVAMLLAVLIPEVVVQALVLTFERVVAIAMIIGAVVVLGGSAQREQRQRKKRDQENSPIHGISSLQREPMNAPQVPLEFSGRAAGSPWPSIGRP
jgi:hypothetical protein